ncbi:hypothetical protein [Pseudobacteroides cellulosolvens]|uniref:Phage head-tail adaptor n=1 Tax=Pseudobacteroides cellulosolvens ATCC 35603 = DSM 2933 TaxID=398512 RepID=A0A0L6JGK3_9FIRM|nr:hypothetical protein [Pseudobacteroides cellulosolvens]KNY24843.1 hypothetical protein Bccel_0100 [Pseudobacteroides cellulosolvens ATCC 35603 = DSM 2933]
MTKDYELVLIDNSASTVNDIGNVITTEVRTPVLCGIRSVTRSEHYAAAANDLKPEIVFIINKYEYTGQKEAEFENARYRIIRTFVPDKNKDISDFEDMELVCSGVME